MVIYFEDLLHSYIFAFSSIYIPPLSKLVHYMTGRHPILISTTLLWFSFATLLLATNNATHHFVSSEETPNASR